MKKSHTFAAFKARRYAWPTTVLALAVGCSFQDFDYLQSGSSTTSGASSGGTTGSSGGGQGGSGASGGGSGGASASASGSGGSGGSGTASGGSIGSTNTSGSVGGAGGADSDTSAGGAAGAAGSPGGGINVLVNPSFEEYWEGWSVSPKEAQGNYVNVKWPQPGSFTPNGEPEENLLGTWHMTEPYTLAIYQSVSGIDDGSYTFKGFFNWGGPVTSLQMFARNCGGDNLYRDVPGTGATQWLEVGVDGIEVTGGNCEVGFTVNSDAAGWVNADMFSLEMDPQ